MPTTAILLLLLFFTLRPLSSTSTLHRRILHQPFLPQDSPPPIPSPPPPPKYPFSGAAPGNSPFFPFYSSPPPPPSPASFASFPANISTLTVPHPSKSSSSSSKLIAGAVAAVIAAVAIVSFAVFLHLRSRTRTNGSSSLEQAKTQRSDNSSTISYNQTPSTHHIPKLQRPSQTSSEFLYLGTMVNSHATGGAAAFNGNNPSRTNCSSAANSRKMESPELRPLPPLNTQQSFGQNIRNNADVISSKDEESEEFYSPKGSINGKESSIGTGSASRRGFAAIEVENFNGSTSNSSSTYSSTVPGSGSGSPVRSLSSSLSPANNLSPRSSMPKSPDLIEIRTIAPLPPQMPSQQEFQESASPSPPSSSSPERHSRRSVESSPRVSNVSDQNVESPMRHSSSVPHSPTTPTEIQGLVFPESAPPLPPSSLSPERYSRSSDESSPRNSNASEQKVESPVRISSSVQHSTTAIQTSSEIPGPTLPESELPLRLSSMSSGRSEESLPRISNASDQNVESPARISSPVQYNTSEIQGLMFSLSLTSLPPSSSPLVTYSRSEESSPPSSSPPVTYSRSEESSPRNSNASNQKAESPVRIGSPVQHNNTAFPKPPGMQNLVFHESASALPLSAMSPEKYFSRSEESSPRSSNVSDQNVESPVRISSPVQHNNTVIPTPTEMQNLVFEEFGSALPPRVMSPEKYLSRREESSPRSSNVSDHNVESPMRINSTVPTPPEMQGLLLEESVSPLPPVALSKDNFVSRNEESSPRGSNISDQNVESPVRISSAVIPTTPEMQGLLLQESALSPEKCLSTSEESSPRSSNVSDQHEGSPVNISSSDQHNSTLIPTPPEMQDFVFQEPSQAMPPIALSQEIYSRASEESSPRISNDLDQNVECPVRFSSSVQDNSTVNPTSTEIKSLKFLESASPLPASSLSPEQYSGRIEGSSPRISNVSDQIVESDVRISSPVQHKSPSPMSSSSSSSERCSRRNEESSPRISNDSVQNVHNNASVIPPPPPPPPPPQNKVSESPRTPTPPAKKLLCEPPALITPLRPIAVESLTLISPIKLPSIDSQTVKKYADNESPNKETEYSSGEVERNEESTPKPKLKPLHWDKVRASSDREMVWDQLKCSSFKLNEEMIETLFVVNTPQPNPKEATRWQVLPSPGQDSGNRVLDPKKAQNIAILLRALHVTVDEVCEGLTEGNADILGTELLESLLKMAPTKEEERKLKEYKDDSPAKLGAAERFLKAVVDIPYAFRRVDAMLYVSNFDSEVEYLKKSFATLEAACEELRTSRMFLKLLEAVLKTGNRMNVGTNRGDAHAFKLDTLLKLVDVKGADGKTTLLHFVVQEIIRTEGARLSGGTPYETSSTNDDAKCRKLGLQVVSALSSELSNVKKAAVMDAEVLNSDVSKLSKGIENIKEIVRLNETVPLDENKFSESMNRFMKRAEEEIFRIQAQESVALTLVKEITEYFHGNSALEEAHPFRIFMVVRDFLTILDRVCKEVGMINERTMVSSAHKFPVPVNPMLQPGFHKRQHTLSDDESFPLNM